MTRGDLAFAGPHTGALLFGVFAVSVPHNRLHFAGGVGMVPLGVATTAFERRRGQYPGREQQGV
ncbi:MULTISPECIES: hypothetical protein [unclassified Saccharothrix]|uniref:hypothetical protein n=1 Tax=unclassified Saccharothrix TaxID=2593673 RepID=UPI00307F4873